MYRKSWGLKATREEEKGWARRQMYSRKVAGISLGVEVCLGETGDV